MKKIELIKKIGESNLRLDGYSLDGGLPNEAYCLNYNMNSCLWEVYYSERGNKNSLNEFEHEEEACNYFYKLVNSDSTR